MEHDFRVWMPMVVRVLEQYDLTVTKISPVRFINSAVFRLDTADGEYALRIHRTQYRRPEQTRSECIYMSGLHMSGLHMSGLHMSGLHMSGLHMSGLHMSGLHQTISYETPQPFKTRTGDFVSFVDVDGSERHCSILSWIPGEVRRPGQRAGPKTLTRIGRALGNIHNFSESFKPPAEFDLPILDVDAQFDSALDTLPAAQRRLFEDVRRRVSIFFGQATHSSSEFGVIHNDFILLNCLHRGQRTSVIDFDDCGWGFYLQDFGGILGNLKDYGAAYPSLRGHFFDGYRLERPLPSENEQDLELMIALRHCSSVLWAINRRAQGAISEEFLQQILDYRLSEIESSLRTLNA